MQLNFLVALLSIFQIAGSLALGAPGLSQELLRNPNGDTFKEIRKLLKKADIIDEIVDDFTPRCFVTPSYGDVLVEYGTHFNTSDTNEKPSISVSCPDYSAKGLTLILTDPDAPSRDNPKWGEMCHWIATVSTNGIDDVIEYKAPGPPAKTGYHRYVFLLLEGENGDLKAPDDRQHWGAGKPGHGVRDWAKAENLKVIGGNFFLEENQEQ